MGLFAQQDPIRDAQQYVVTENTRQQRAASYRFYQQNRFANRSIIHHAPPPDDIRFFNSTLPRHYIILRITM